MSENISKRIKDEFIVFVAERIRKLHSIEIANNEPINEDDLFDTLDVGLLYHKSAFLQKMTAQKEAHSYDLDFITETISNVDVNYILDALSVNSTGLANSFLSANSPIIIDSKGMLQKNTSHVGYGYSKHPFELVLAWSTSRVLLDSEGSEHYRKKLFYRAVLNGDYSNYIENENSFFSFVINNTFSRDVSEAIEEESFVKEYDVKTFYNENTIHPICPFCRTPLYLGNIQNYIYTDPFICNDCGEFFIETLPIYLDMQYLIQCMYYNEKYPAISYTSCPTFLIGILYSIYMQVILNYIEKNALKLAEDD